MPNPLYDYGDPDHPLLRGALPLAFDPETGVHALDTGDPVMRRILEERQRSVDMGLADPNSAWLPTGRGLVHAAGQYGQGVMLGTTAPGRSPMANPAFRDWFGKSHVVDEAGQPRVVYKGMHPYDWSKGAPTEIESISRPEEFPSFHKGEPGVRIAGFFSDSPEIANRFANPSTEGAIYPTYLSFQKPYIIDAAGEKAGNVQFGESGKAFRNAIRSGDYDGVIIRNTADEGNIYVALHPTQIKSAISNTGAYNPSDPRLTYGIGAGALGGNALNDGATNAQQE